VTFKVLTAASMKLRVFWAIIDLMMEAVRTSETSVHFNVTTRRYIPEDSKQQQIVSVHNKTQN
jgi:hypothetical protein